MFFDIYVVVDVNPHLLPLGIDVGLCWQGLLRRLIRLFKLLPAATQMATPS